MAHPKFVEGAAKIASEGDHDERKLAIAAVNAYGIEAIKATFLLNGGAIIALLALLGGLLSKESLAVSGIARAMTKALMPGFQFYIAGVVAASLTAGIGYLNWTLVAQQRFQPGHWQDWLANGTWYSSPRAYGLIIETTRVVAILLFFGSLFCFARGSWIIARAFQKIPI